MPAKTMPRPPVSPLTRVRRLGEHANNHSSCLLPIRSSSPKQSRRQYRCRRLCDCPVAFVEPPLDGPTVDVRTTEGLVRGITDCDVHVFLGVPCAAPVGGPDRWLPPRPSPPRTAVFDASEREPSCEQTVPVIPRFLLSEAAEVTMYEMTDIEGFASQEKSPDCLRLNIWTPTLPDASPETRPPGEVDVAVDATDATLGGDGAVADGAVADGAVADGAPADTARVDDAVAGAATVAATPKGLPVIVKLHGGGLGIGSSQHPALDGEILARKGVVVVTINYRLGPIGFLAADGLFEGEVLKGNRGFMDTVRALEWVRDNIEGFGGDPANVTLMGQSGGGTAVWSVIASPASKGLVHRAIIMSGPIYDYPIAEQSLLAKAVLKEWDVAEGDIDALAKVSMADATSTITTTTVVGAEAYGSMGRIALPNAAATGTDFMPDTIFAAIEKGRFNDIDLLVGNCDDDWAVSTMAVPLPTSMAIGIWNGFIKGMTAETDEGFDEMTKKYVAAQPEVSATRAKGVLQTDALYRLRALKAATMHSNQTTEPSLGKTYAYQFRWKSPSYPEGIGAMHGLDLTFAFGNVHKFPRSLGNTDGIVAPATQRLADAMGDMVVSFATTGSPSSSLLPEWPEYEADRRQTMVFDEVVEVVSDPQGTLRKLWVSEQ